jgi:hypothetical protein
MTLIVGRSITSIQLSVGELQKECASFQVELDTVLALARQIQSDATALINEWDQKDETSTGRTNIRPVYGGVVMRPTCGSCRHFNLLGGDGETSYMGECRRRSPELLVDEDGTCEPGWPPVDEIHWCGEYSPETLS